MDTKFGDAPWWVVIVFVLAVLLVNVAGHLASKDELVGDWYEGAVFATLVPLFTGLIAGWVLVFAIGASAHLAVGLYAAYRLVSSRPPRPRHSRRA